MTAPLPAPLSWPLLVVAWLLMVGGLVVIWLTCTTRPVEDREDDSEDDR